METFKTATCISCHAADLKGASGPSLRGVGDTHTKEEIMAIIENGQGGMPPMKDIALGAGVTEEQLDQLADWLASQKAEAAAE